MKKTRLFILAAALLLSFNSFAQCPWTVNSGVQNISCNGNCDGKIVTSTTAPSGYTFTFLWSTGETTHYIDKVCAGTYTITISDDKGCSTILTFDVTTPKVLEVTCQAIVPTAPGTLTANVTGGTPPYSFSWNTIPAQTTQTITNVPAGSYQVNVTDANGCANSSNCKIDVGNITCGGRTQTQGGWGAPPNGNNPGAYMTAHFAAAFPNGVSIGCNNTFKLTTSQAVTDFLPSGTAPKALPAGNMVNNVSYKNVLAAQLLSAVLSVGFDYQNANFSPASITLDNQIITSGVFAGKTVGFLISEANKKIGGCTSVYSLGDLNDALDMVNNNYDDGTINKGNLACSQKAKLANEVISEDGLSFKVYPNPFSTVANLEIKSAKDSHVKVELLDLTGRVVKSLYEGDTKQDDAKTIAISSDELRSGIYLLKIKSDNEVYNQRLFIQK
ncbi:MAG: T9SS type A sorting domain-containing protein [Bacteroidia bacterium]